METGEGFRMKIKRKLDRQFQHGLVIDNRKVELPGTVPLLYKFNEDAVIGSAKVTLEGDELIVDANFNASQMKINLEEHTPDMDKMKEMLDSGDAGIFPAFTFGEVETINNKKVPKDVRLVTVSFTPPEGTNLNDMVDLNKDGTIDLNDLAVRITKNEKGVKEVDIGQTKEIIKLAAEDVRDCGEACGRLK